MSDQNERQPLLDRGDICLPGYLYSATGGGVPKVFAEAVIKSWGCLSPYGDAPAVLRQVDTAHIMTLENLARLAALAVAETIVDKGYVIPEAEDDEDA